MMTCSVLVRWWWSLALIIRMWCGTVQHSNSSGVVVAMWCSKATCSDFDVWYCTVGSVRYHTLYSMVLYHTLYSTNRGHGGDCFLYCAVAATVVAWQRGCVVWKVVAAATVLVGCTMAQRERSHGDDRKGCEVLNKVRSRKKILVVTSSA